MRRLEMREIFLRYNSFNAIAEGTPRRVILLLCCTLFHIFLNSTRIIHLPGAEPSYFL
jgi:hypothetical protein